MGLLSDLLLLPVMGPVRGLRFIAEQVQAELIRLSVQRDLGQISEDEYAAQEEALLEQLNVLQADTEDVGGS